MKWLAVVEHNSWKICHLIKEVKESSKQKFLYLLKIIDYINDFYPIYVIHDSDSDSDSDPVMISCKTD